jgi:hypothetical protein
MLNISKVLKGDRWMGKYITPMARYPRRGQTLGRGGYQEPRHLTEIWNSENGSSMVQHPLPSASSSSQAKGPTDGEYKFLPSFCKLRQAYGEDYASRRKILEKQTIRVAKNSSQVNLQSLENHLESKKCKKIQEALFQWSVVLSEKERFPKRKGRTRLAKNGSTLFSRRLKNKRLSSALRTSSNTLQNIPCSRRKPRFRVKKARWMKLLP